LANLKPAHYTRWAIREKIKCRIDVRIVITKHYSCSSHRTVNSRNLHCAGHAAQMVVIKNWDRILFGKLLLKLNLEDQDLDGRTVLKWFLGQ
jgi:hypothetical protein